MSTTSTILISGWGASRSHMADLAERLGLQDFLALSLADLYERGNAVGEKRDGVSLYSAALESLLSEISSPVSLIGWSTGGVVALETAGRLHDRLRRLILLSTTPKFCADDAFPHGTPPAALRAMIHGLRRAPEQTVATFLSQAAVPVKMDEEKIKESIADSMAKGTGILLDGLKFLKYSDCRNTVAKIKCPSLIIHGRKDRIIPWRAAEWLHQNILQSELLLYPRGGHLLLAQYGHEIVPKIAEWIHDSA